MKDQCGPFHLQNHSRHYKTPKYSTSIKLFHSVKEEGRVFFKERIGRKKTTDGSMSCSLDTFNRLIRNRRNVGIKRPQVTNFKKNKTFLTIHHYPS